MDFFAAQDRSRRQTRWLLVMFTLALLAIVAAVDLVVVAAFYPWLRGGGTTVWLQAPLMVTTVATLVVVLSVSGFRIWRLAEGGAAVARMVGARQIARGTNDANERRLLNIVDEMAIASGTAVPGVFVLDSEASINAFAAGYSPNQATIVVTRGMLGYLTRDELQAVIAHEFSHILNGDMRLNVHLLGWLAGILVLGSIGEAMIYASVRKDSDDWVSWHDFGWRGLAVLVWMLVVGGALVAVGYVGVFMGRVIKAGVSREREFLADASAVQFTRDPESLARALHKIGLQSRRARISGRFGEELSHMLFSSGRPIKTDDWLATHPPVSERIGRVHPHFTPPTRLALPPALDPPPAVVLKSKYFTDGRPIVPAAEPVMPEYATLPALEAVSYAAEAPASVLAAVGNPDHRHLGEASALVSALPPAVLASVRSRAGAQAAVAALLLDRRPDVRARQVAALDAADVAGLAPQALALEETMATLDPRCRLPLLDLALAELSSLPAPQRRAFLAVLDTLIRADGRLTIPEFVIQVIMENGLRPGAARVPPVKY
ncbi:MAG: M48 family metallopeptidase, partial [Casimicrobiaceae bacterium]